MRKSFYKVVNLVLASMLLTSCDKCEDAYADIDYTIVCSDDLLDYATPEVTYKGNDGTVNTFSISEGEWIEADNLNNNVNTKIVIGNDTISKSRKIKKWTKHVHYDDFSIIDDEISVKYIPKASIPTGKVYIADFVHQVTGSLSFRDDDGNQYEPIFIEQNVNGPIDLTGKSSLSDIINTFNDHYGFHVESNGKYSKK